MQTALLGEVAEFISGFAFKSSAFNVDGVGMPLVRIRDVVPGKSGTYYSGQYDKRFLVEDGDYLIGMDGEFNLAKWRGGRALLNQRVCKVAELDSGLDRGYLGHFLPRALKAIEDITPFATVKHLSVKSLRQIEIPLPPLDEQRRIAAILDHADSLRAKRKQVLAHFDALVHSIYFAMFEGRDWPSTLLVELADSPDDIKCGPFGTQLNASEFRSFGVPLLGIKNVNAKFKLPPFEFIDAPTAARLSTYDLQPGDLVMTRKGTIGNCAIYPAASQAGVMHSDLLRARISPRAANVVFVEHHLQLSPRISHQIRMMSPGAVMPGINVTKLKQLAVEVPPLALQHEFASRISLIDGQRSVAQRAVTADSEVFDSLQSRAFRGEL